MDTDFDALRQRMVDRQICARGIREPAVGAAFRKVPRHLFLPASQQSEAYEDHPVGIGKGQTISQPYMVALMTEELGIEEGHRVLEIGTGSGYQTAILAELASEVYTVERIAELSETAQGLLGQLGHENIRFLAGDGTVGWPEHKPYDRIIVTAGGPRVPSSLVDQLAVGGRLVIPVGDTFHQSLTVVTKTEKGTHEKRGCGCVFVKLIGEEGWE